MVWSRISVAALLLALATPALAAEIEPGPTATPIVRKASVSSFAELGASSDSLRPSLPLLLDWAATHKPLAGRTLAVSAATDIKLHPHEVILTFDDGPTTGRTDRVLNILDTFGVKAVFMMVGKMAELHPRSARAVALDGQTIGTHTYDHPNLSKLAPGAAFAEIQHGKDAVAAVLVPVHAEPSPFFRFPYLAATWLLQASLTVENTIILGVQIDSDDYFKNTPDDTLKHLLARLDQRGKGIVLFHDIQPKTLIVLPEFLQALSDRGYTVVHLVAKQPNELDEPVITASR